MCGIVGYLGTKPAQPILLEGLKRLEYRGYDSAGVALHSEGKLHLGREVGRISGLEEALTGSPLSGTLGIAHTRWATHGKPTAANAHPHTDSEGRIAIVHNGIVENYGTLKKWLSSRGCQFTSETDSEVLAHLIAECYKDALTEASRENPPSRTNPSANRPADLDTEAILVQAVQTALREVQGTFGLAIVSRDHPDLLIATRRGSPLILGIGVGEYILASDAAAIIEHTSQAIYLSDNDMAVIRRDGYRTLTLDNRPMTRQVETIETKLEEIERADFPHYMLKEIFEQPEVLRACLGGRIDTRNDQVILGGIQPVVREFTRARRLIITGCGTAWHAGLVGEYLFESLAAIATEVDYASEFRYRNPIIEEGTAQIVISQSGETIDTLASLREAAMRGALTLGVVNAVGSTIARETDAGVYLHVGPEIGVASTKAFTGQVAVLTLLALTMARRRHLPQSTLSAYLSALEQLPEQVNTILGQSDAICEVARTHQHQENWLFLGRGVHFPVALEGALKLKEISYIHAEGLPASEMKHGPIALITPEMPVVFICPQGTQYDKVIGNIEEVRARGGRIIAVASEDDQHIGDYADHVFTIPDTLEELQPILAVIPLQLLAYHAAVLRGHDVDKPRHLAKSVTVE